jgi:hypothetical protein
MRRSLRAVRARTVSPICLMCARPFTECRRSCCDHYSGSGQRTAETTKTSCVVVAALPPVRVPPPKTKIRLSTADAPSPWRRQWRQCCPSVGRWVIHPIVCKHLLLWNPLLAPEDIQLVVQSGRGQATLCLRHGRKCLPAVQLGVVNLERRYVERHLPACRVVAGCYLDIRLIRCRVESSQSAILTSFSSAWHDLRPYQDSTA